MRNVTIYCTHHQYIEYRAAIMVMKLDVLISDGTIYLRHDVITSGSVYDDEDI